MGSPTRVVTARLDEKLAGELDSLATSMRRSKAFLISEAVANYVAVNAWQVRAIEEAMADVRRGGPTIPHDKVMAWLESWGTAEELPPPEAD